ncbi:MAG TPA: DUF3800 domain-containing protein [Patescibacteria group bacterium]|jgi:hypothetical protein|nr:DUF3800 domain-containing protein [Patescibacteria group bacterium]
MLKIYVDESGDLGMNNGYFIIAMVQANNSNRLKNIIRSFCSFNEVDEVHASHLSFPAKQYLLNKLTKESDHTIRYVVLDKMRVINKMLYKSNNLLFNYLFYILVADLLKTVDEDIYIVLDNRNQKVSSLNSLADYVKIKAYSELGFKKDIIIQYMDSKDCKALQISDLVANIIWRRYHWNNSDLYSKLLIKKRIKFPYKTFRLNIHKR